MKASATVKKDKHETILKNLVFSPSKLNKVEERRAQIRALSNLMIIVFLFSTLLLAYYFEGLTDFVAFIGSGYWVKMFFGFMVLFFLLLLADKERNQRIVNSHLFKDLSERENKLQTLYVLASAINKSSDFKEILNLMSVLVCVSLSSDACSIYFYKKKSKELKPGTWHSFNNHQYENLLQSSVSLKKEYKHPLIKAFRSYKPFYIKNIASDVEYSEFNSKENFNQFTTFLSTPLLLEGKIIGLLAVFYRDEKGIEEDDRKMLETMSHELSASFEKWQQIDKLKKMTELKEALTHKVFKAQEDERKRIALSIHDDLLQTVVASLYRLSSWDNGKSKKLEIESGELESVMQILRDSVASTRRLINDLRPPTLDDLGLKPALRKLAKDTQNVGNINVEIKIKHIPRLKPMQELIVYRIAQEALANCLKHSQADNAIIKLSIYRNNLILTVKDDGKGIIVDRLNLPGSNGGLGIQAMKERALMAGGNFKIRKLRKGTEVKASIPLAAGVN